MPEQRFQRSLLGLVLVGCLVLSSVALVAVALPTFGPSSDVAADQQTSGLNAPETTPTDKLAVTPLDPEPGKTDMPGRPTPSDSSSPSDVDGSTESDGYTSGEATDADKGSTNTGSESSQPGLKEPSTTEPTSSSSGSSTADASKPPPAAETPSSPTTTKPASTPTTKPTTTTKPPATTTPAPAGPSMHNATPTPKNQLLSGHSGWSSILLDGSEAPRDSQSGPFPNIGTFRVFCRFSHQNFDDAIVFPGVVNATHLHSYFGNTATKATSTGTTISSGGNSTCAGGTADRSAYWIPSVYDTSKSKLVRPEFAAIYYQSGFGNGIDPTKIQPIPDGLMILAGRSSASPSNPISQQVGYWGCFNNGPPTNISNTIPDCPSTHRVTLVVNFPQCWDGVRKDSPNHQSHMAYPSWNNGCPSSHPVVLPRIMLQVIYPTESHGTTGWNLTSDMYPSNERGGASIHADFVNGWNKGIMDRWLDNCIRAVKDCERSELGGGERLRFSFFGSNAPITTTVSAIPSAPWSLDLLGAPIEGETVQTAADKFAADPFFCGIFGHKPAPGQSARLTTSGSSETVSNPDRSYVGSDPG